MDSITPEALAASRSIPFPCDTAMEREFGRHTMTTGMPTLSSPVTLAILVMPMTGSNPRTRSSVCWGAIRRCVPRQNVFLAAAGKLPASSALVLTRPLFAAVLSERGKLDHVHLHTKEKLASIFEKRQVVPIKSGEDVTFRDFFFHYPQVVALFDCFSRFFCIQTKTLQNLFRDDFGGPYPGRAYLNFRSIPQSPATSIGGKR